MSTMNSISSQKYEAAFMCKWDSCTAKFKTKTSLRCHIGTHPPQQVFICKWESCERQFCHMAQYLSHYKVHARQKPFFCEECADSFSRRTYLKEHLLSHDVTYHKVKNESEVLSPFKQNNSHIKDVDENGEVYYLCNINGCTKSYRHRQSLHWHKLAHHKNSGSDNNSTVGLGTNHSGSLSPRDEVTKRKLPACSDNTSTVGLGTNHSGSLSPHDRGVKRKQADRISSSPERDEDLSRQQRRKMDHRQGPFACPVKGCKSVVKLYSSLRRHLRIHNKKVSSLVNGTTEPKDKSGDEESENSVVIREALTRFASSGSFPCKEPGCERSYRYPRSLQRHRNNRHLSAEDKNSAAASKSARISERRKSLSDTTAEEAIEEPHHVIVTNVPHKMTALELEAETITAVASLTSDIDIHEHEIKLEFVDVQLAEFANFDCENMNQEAIGEESQANMFEAALEEDAIAMGEETVAVEEDAIAMGEETVAVEEDAIAMGEETAAVEEEKVVVEEQTVAVEEEKVVVEEEKVAVEEETVAVEEETVAVEEDAIAMGEETVAVEEDAIAMGEETVAVEEEKVVMEEESMDREECTDECEQASNETEVKMGVEDSEAETNADEVVETELSSTEDEVEDDEGSEETSKDWSDAESGESSPSDEDSEATDEEEEAEDDVEEDKN